MAVAIEREVTTGRRPGRPAADRDQMLSLWNSGLSFDQIGAAMGVSKHTVRCALYQLQRERRAAGE